MYRFLILILLLTACSFGSVPSVEEKKSFACENDKAMCIAVKETCILVDKKKQCFSSLDVFCNARGDEGDELVWQNKSTTIGNTTLTLTCQVSHITN